MKICHLVLSLNPGGMENGIINVASTLDESEFATEILCIRELGTMAERLPEKVKVSSLGYRSGFHWRGVLQIAQYLKNTNCDLLFTHNAATLTWGGLAQLFCPKVKWLHGEHGFPKGVTLLKPIQRWLIRRADQITAVSESLVSETHTAYGHNSLKIKVIRNGVDEKRFFPAEPELRNDIRKRLNIPLDSYVLTVAGRLESRKNQAFAIQCLFELKKRNNAQYSLILIGDGADKNELERLAQDLGVCNETYFLGYRNDIADILRASDLLLQCATHGEGMSNVIIEANACGIPVLASAISGNTDIVEHSKNGLLLKLVGDECNSEWTNAIENFRNEKIELCSDLHAFTMDHYSMNKMTSDYSALYHSLKHL